MDELVADDVIGVGERSAERQHDAAAQRLGDAAGALAELALNRVGLLEVRMRRVEHERLPSAQLVPEEPLEARVPAFRHPRGDVDPFTLFRVVVDVEMLGLQDLKIELSCTEPCCGRSIAPTQAAWRRRTRRTRCARRERPSLKIMDVLSANHLPRVARARVGLA